MQKSAAYFAPETNGWVGGDGVDQAHGLRSRLGSAQVLGGLSPPVLWHFRVFEGAQGMLSAERGLSKSKKRQNACTIAEPTETLPPTLKRGEHFPSGASRVTLLTVACAPWLRPSLARGLWPFLALLQ